MKELIGESKQLQIVRARLKAVSSSDRSVVIIGEQGVGKSVVAENIHALSAAEQKPFVHLNLSVIDELRLRTLVQSLLEDRLFVNPATSDHGNFDLPDGASVIVEGIETLGLAGSRILADLVEGFSKKKYRIRLIFLLTHTPKDALYDHIITETCRRILETWECIEIPPLRDRQDDIPELIEHFVRQTAKELNLGEVIVDINAVSVLSHHEWKGNVQELKTFVEQAMMLSSDKETFTLPESLIDEQSELTQMLHRIDKGIDFALDKSMELIERRILERVLAKFEFNQSRAARFLKITEDTLRYRMKKLGIPTSTAHGQ